jgi:hypothetical protein
LLVRSSPLFLRSGEETEEAVQHYAKLRAPGRKDLYGLKRVRHHALKAKQKELFNFQKIAATLADYGFNCIKLADDWQAADFLAYHFNGNVTLKVQLKQRVAKTKKYIGKDIWMACPHKGCWYLIEHDRLFAKVGECTKWLNAPSWKTKKHTPHAGSTRDC